MEGLHNRKTKVNEEDGTEFLDEQGIWKDVICTDTTDWFITEQEELLQVLRDQNNKANLAIQVCSCLVFVFSLV